MRVEVNVLDSGTEPRVSVQHQPALMMALRAGSHEVGSRCLRRSRLQEQPWFCRQPDARTGLRSALALGVVRKTNLAGDPLALVGPGRANSYALRRSSTWHDFW
jgi:hypothetical protein